MAAIALPQAFSPLPAVNISSWREAMTHLSDVIQSIRRDAHQLPPGTNLGHLWRLSRVYNAGCSQVSEAMKRLAYEGIVEYRRGVSRGFFTRDDLDAKMR